MDEPKVIASLTFDFTGSSDVRVGFKMSFGESTRRHDYKSMIET